METSYQRKRNSRSSLTSLTSDNYVRITSFKNTGISEYSMRAKIALLFTGILACWGSAFAQQCQPVPDKVNKFISSYTSKVRGAEFCESRHITRGDLDSDGVEDLVVMFTIEGACLEDKQTPAGACGNRYTTYLKAFLGKDLKEVPLLAIGGSARAITSMKLTSGKIEVNSLSHTQGDSHCCPSLKGKALFVLKSGILAETR